MPATETRTPTGERRGDIQGLRAVAVVLVVLYHAGEFVPGGYVGVDVFFVISGYVIARLLVGELRATDAIDFRAFYFRRARRILPALGLMLAVVLLAGVLLAPYGAQSTTAETGVAAALFNANHYLILSGDAGYFALSSETNALLHTWSLSVEEQFYFVFPAVLAGAWLAGGRWPRIGRHRAVAAALAAIVLASFGISFAFTNGWGISLVDGRDIAFNSSVTRAWEFAVGAVLLVVSGRVASIGRRAATVLGAAGATLVTYAAFAFDDATPFPGSAAAVPVAGTVLLIAAGERANPLSAALAWRPAQRLGDLSYSWYLWHWPVIVYAGATWPGAGRLALGAAALASLAPAVASARFVENPIRFRPRPAARRTVALAVVCVTAPILAGATMVLGERGLGQTERLQEFERGVRPHVDTVNGCMNATPLGERDLTDCRWEVDGAVGEAVLIGDSNAGHFAEGFVAGMHERGLDATVAVMASCPFLDVVVVRDGVADDRCRTFVTESVDDLIEMRPELVVIASSSDGYIESRGAEIDDTAGIRYRTPNEKRAAWEVGLAATLATLGDAGIDVAVVHPVPKFPGWNPRTCAVVRLLFDAPRCGRTASADDVRRRRARAIAAERAAIAAAGVRGLDVSPSLCAGDRCATVVDGEWRWRDGAHISVGASVALAAEFASLAG